MTLTSAFHSKGTWPGVEAAPGVERRVLTSGDHMMVVQFTIQPGAEVPLHTHPHEQIGYVAKGAIEFTIGEEKVVIRAGDGYVIPGGVPHGCLALEDSLALDIFAPVREEYK